MNAVAIALALVLLALPSHADETGAIHAANTPDLKTESGRYKQYVYSVIGSHWYPGVNQHYNLIPIGTVEVQFTIHSDGTIRDVKVVMVKVKASE